MNFDYNSNKDHFRLGISVSKKLGNAVTRNRIKRAIRENFKIHKEDIIGHILSWLPSNNDNITCNNIFFMNFEILPYRTFNSIARQPAKDMTTLEIQGSLEHVLKIAKVFNKKIK
jgi:ribonuclease P protein component